MLEVLLFIVAIWPHEIKATDMSLLALWKWHGEIGDSSTAETVANDMAFACPCLLLPCPKT